MALKIVTVKFAVMSEHLHSFTQPNAERRSIYEALDMNN
jgi:hypothetical protein